MVIESFVLMHDVFVVPFSYIKYIVWSYPYEYMVSFLWILLCVCHAGS